MADEITAEGAEYVLDIMRQSDPGFVLKDADGRPITDPAARLEEVRLRFGRRGIRPAKGAPTTPWPPPR
jgi:LDH2 family malate/lactate/ureidoglycolate dehydrogenase